MTHQINVTMTSCCEYPSSKNKSVQILLVMILTVVCLVGGCSRKSIVVDANPSTVSFRISGGESVRSFQISNDKSVLWRIAPKGTKYVSLDEFKTVQYGKVPDFCVQDVPEVGTLPPPLVAGQIYSASAEVYDNPPVVVKFRVIDGKVRSEP